MTVIIPISSWLNTKEVNIMLKDYYVITIENNNTQTIKRIGIELLSLDNAYVNKLRTTVEIFYPLEKVPFEIEPKVTNKNANLVFLYFKNFSSAYNFIALYKKQADCENKKLISMSPDDTKRFEALGFDNMSRTVDFGKDDVNIDEYLTF